MRGRLAQSVARHPWRWLLGGLLAAALALIPASRLRPEVDLAELLPEGSAAATDYRTFLETFGGLEKVFVVLWSEDPERVGQGDLLEIAWRFQELLEESDRIAGVRAGTTEDDEEFLFRWVAPRMALLLPDGVARLEERSTPEAVRWVAERLHASSQVPGGEVRLELAVHDPLGLSEELASRAGDGSLPIEPMTGAFLNGRGDTTLLVLQPRAAEIDPAGGRELRALLEECWREIEGELETSGVGWQATGGPLYAAADEELIRRDMIRTVGTSVAGCLVVLLLAFVGWATAAATTVTLAVGAAWLAGVLGLVSDRISALSLGFAAVLVGLGIDYAIHGATRYREARGEGASPEEALELAFARSGSAIAASAATTAGAFAVLFFAHFRPLYEVGLVVAVGIVCVALATATVGGATLVLIDRRWPRALGIGSAGDGSVESGGVLWRALGRWPAVVAHGAARRPIATLTAALALSVVAVMGLRELSLESDPRSLRPEGHPAIAAEERLVREFGLGFETATAVVVGRNLDEALERAARAAEALRARLGVGAAVGSPSDWLVSSRTVADRLVEIAALDLEDLPARLREAMREENLSPRYFEPGLAALERLVSGVDPGAPPDGSWPDWLSEQVVSSGGRTAIALRVRAGEEDADRLGSPELAAALQTAAPGASLASSARLGEELRQLAVLDATRLVEIALLAVAFLVTLSLRGRLRLALFALTPVIGGTLWTFGIWGFVVGDCDLMSLAVAPILLGIGIDDGLHATHGAAASGSLLEGVVSAGRAMTLTTVTTMVGFGSLAVSSIPGLRMAGLLIALGVSLCLLTTLVVLPAIGGLIEERSK